MDAKTICVGDRVRYVGKNPTVAGMEATVEHVGHPLCTIRFDNGRKYKAPAHRLEKKIDAIKAGDFVQYVGPYKELWQSKGRVAAVGGDYCHVVFIDDGSSTTTPLHFFEKIKSDKIDPPTVQPHDRIRFLEAAGRDLSGREGVVTAIAEDAGHWRVHAIVSYSPFAYTVSLPMHMVEKIPPAAPKYIPHDPYYELGRSLFGMMSSMAHASGGVVEPREVSMPSILGAGYEMYVPEESAEKVDTVDKTIIVHNMSPPDLKINERAVIDAIRKHIVNQDIAALRNPSDLTREELIERLRNTYGRPYVVFNWTTKTEETKRDWSRHPFVEEAIRRLEQSATSTIAV